jgi:hypothetical protein
MSRHDIIVNTLLGLLLVAAPALLFFLAFAVLKGAGLVIASFWPQVAHSQDVALLGFMALGALASAIRHSRKRRWHNAFLSFAALPMFLSIWFAGAHSSFGLNGDWLIAGLLFAFFIPPDSAPTRFQFFVAASAISAVVAVNTGLLGSGFLARIVADCALAGYLAWFVWNARKTEDPQAPLSPTNA